MLKKILSMTLCLTIMLLPLTACTKVPTVLVDKDNSPLMIYIKESNEFLKYHIDNYNARHDERQIEYEVFKENQTSFMYEKIDKEMQKGKGPDLIYTDGWFFGSDNMEEIMGNFVDMDELIERSPMFKMEEYNTNVLDAAIINNKRLFIPISYNTSIVVSTIEDLYDYYPDASLDLDYDMYLDAVNKYLDDHPDNIACHRVDIVYPVLINQIEQNKYVEISPRLEKALEILQKQCSRDVRYSDVDDNYNDWLFRYSNRSIFNIPDELKDNTSIFAELYFTYNVLNSLGKQMLVFTPPTLIKEHNAYYNLGFAINSYSQKQNKAMRFIEYMLSVEVQASKVYPPRLPVNNEALEISIDYFCNGEYDLFKDDFKESPLPQSLVADSLYIIKNAKTKLQIDKENDKKYLDTIYTYLYDIQCGTKKVNIFNMIDSINDDLADYYSSDSKEDEQ